MNSKRTFFRTLFFGFAIIASLSFAALHTQRSYADPLNCGNTVSGSTQQGAICLPTDPTGVTSAIPDTSVKGVILQVLQIMLSFAMLLAIAFVIIGGYQYIFDGGNGERAKKGKSTVINALIGIVIIILSWTIVSVVTSSAENLNSNGSSGSSDSSSQAATPAAPSN